MANAPTIKEKGSDGVEFFAATPASQPGDVFPAGVMLHFAGAAAPTGWLICDGSVVSRATYPNLFAAIGTTFGAGDGSTTFGIPDTRGRSVVSKHSSGTFVTLGQTGGEENHVLLTAEMPSHNHGGATGGGTTNTESADHTHSGATGGSGFSFAYDSNINLFSTFIRQGTAGTAFPVSDHTHSFTTGGRSAAHTHTVPTLSISSQGGGTSHNNMSPYIVLNHIIRAY